ncbi:MAG TPA: metalloregulator ArsR/SmtB family transcription factor [Candidatus Dormibacteraeota bacterium]|nr:metalloregulator ArsR/SmtB family transcription factor [Candidatus Dormibacteraeota bacterium]
MDTKTFSALAEPNRFRIIELLREQPHSVNEFVELLEMRQPQASKHLRILNDAGLVIVKPVAQQRVYTLNPDAFFQLDEWINSFSKLWNNRLDKLDEHLKTINKKG